MAIVPLAAKQVDLPQIQQGIRWASRRAGVKMRIRNTYDQEAAGESGEGTLFPVFLELSSGIAGTSMAMCSFKYYVAKASSADTEPDKTRWQWWTAKGWGRYADRIEVNPIGKGGEGQTTEDMSGGYWKRSDNSKYVAANYGYARTTSRKIENSTVLVLELGWINEVFDLTACV